MHPTVDFVLFELPVYTVLMMLGSVCGLLGAYLFLKGRYRRAASLSIFLDGALVVFISGCIGARIYHVITHWEYYGARPDEIAQIGMGGLAIRGALLAALPIGAIYAYRRKLNLGRLADGAAIGLSLGQAVGWVGALVQGANYGVVSDSQVAVDLPDVYGLVAPRFPLQPAQIVLFGGLFIGLLLLNLRKPLAGTLFLGYMLVASAANFVLGFQRGDETLYVENLRIDQWVDAALALGALALVFWQVTRHEGNSGINQ